MSGTQPEDASHPRRNWTSSPELNETREPFLSPSADYDDEEFLRYLWKEYLHPKEYEWALIAGYIVVFIVALVGNVLGECGAPKLLPSPFFFFDPRVGFTSPPGWTRRIPSSRATGREGTAGHRGFGDSRARLPSPSTGHRCRNRPPCPPRAAAPPLRPPGGMLLPPAPRCAGNPKTGVLSGWQR